MNYRSNNQQKTSLWIIGESNEIDQSLIVDQFNSQNVNPMGSQPFQSQFAKNVDITSLDTSTMLSYQDFITKTTKENNLNKFLLNSTHANVKVDDTICLLTDDD
jgi:hypothetical protein